MFGKPNRFLCCVAVLLTTTAAARAATVPTPEEMWAVIQQQQAEIEALQQQLSATQQQARQTERKVTATDEKLELTAELIDQSAGALSTTARWAENTSFGGYGELHHNNLDSKKEIDYHRFVLFMNHRFTDRIRFVSELELEHSIAGEGQNGEFELEQAYLEFDIGENSAAKAGLFLVPVGILNETHEPPTFFGVERNPIESNIIPSTWWEAGGAFSGRFGRGFSYDLALTSGLDVPQSGSNAFRVRSGRQKVSEARADAGAFTGRLRWTGAPGIELAASAQYQDDITQGDLGIGATLLEAHADIRRGPFGLRALYAQWDIDNPALIAAADPAAAGRDEQRGWYIEPSLRGSLGQIPGEFGAFVRYNVWDNNAGDSASASAKQQLDAGISYWPTANVVLKFDVTQQDNENGTDDNGFNLGLGYQF